MSGRDGDGQGTPAKLLTRAFVLVALAHFFHAMSIDLYLHLPGYLASLGASEVRIGVVFGMGFASAIAARPLMGRIMDRRGRRPVVLAGGLLTTAASALYPLLDDVGTGMVGVRLLHGLGMAMLFAALFAIAADIVPPARRIQGIAIFGISGMLPMGLAGLLGDRLLQAGSYLPVFVAATAFASGGLLLSLLLAEPPKDGAAEPPRGVLAAAREPALLPVWFVGLAFATSLAADFTFMKTFVLERGVGSVGLFFATYSGAAVALRLFFGGLPDRFGAKRVLLPSMLCLALGLALVARATTAAEIGVAGVLAGLGHGFAFPILLGLVVARSRPSERGAGLALFTALFDAGMMVGGPAFGVIVKLAGYEAMFTSAAALCVVGAAGFAYADRGR